jgi:hypothetical protein
MLPYVKAFSWRHLIIHDSFNHLVELGFDFGRKVGLKLIDLGELGEGLAAIPPVVVDAGYPVGFYR